MKEILPSSSERLVKLLGGQRIDTLNVILNSRDCGIGLSNYFPAFARCSSWLDTKSPLQIYEGLNGPRQCMKAAMLPQQKCKKN